MSGFVAVIATTKDVTDGTWCDVSVIEATPDGELTENVLLAARLPVKVDDPDKYLKFEGAAIWVLAASGWAAGNFEATDNAFMADAWQVREDDRDDPEGRDNHSRLMCWVKHNVPDQRVRPEGQEVLLLSGGELWDLLFEAAERFYHYGTDDVEAHPRRMAEFFGGIPDMDGAGTRPQSRHPRDWPRSPWTP